MLTEGESGTNGNLAEGFPKNCQTHHLRNTLVGGRGIVTFGGGLESFPSLWVSLKEIRRLGCSLPVQVWCFGRRELTLKMRQLLQSIEGVEVVDADKVRNPNSGRVDSLRVLSRYALSNSTFEEVLCLKPYVIPVIDVTCVFDYPSYSLHGALVWYETVDERGTSASPVNSGKTFPDFHVGVFAVQRLFSGTLPNTNFPSTDKWCGAPHEYGVDGVRLFLSPLRLEAVFVRPNQPLQPVESDFRQACPTFHAHVDALSAQWTPSLYEPLEEISALDKQLADSLRDHRQFNLVIVGKGVWRIIFKNGHRLSQNAAGAIGWHVQGGRLWIGWPTGEYRTLAPSSQLDGQWMSVERGNIPNAQLLPFTDKDAELQVLINLAPNFTVGDYNNQNARLVLSPEGGVIPPQISRQNWAVSKGRLVLIGKQGHHELVNVAFLSGSLTNGSTALQLRQQPRRRYLVHGLQRTCTNLVQYFFDRRLGAPRTTRFYGRHYWKHGWLPSTDSLGDTLIVICVRHPFDWLVACYEYFCRECGADKTICGNFEPTWSFEDFIQHEHYCWPSPVERWNIMNQHWAERVREVGRSGIIIRAESLQAPELQSQVLQELAAAYDPYVAGHVDKSAIAKRMTNVCSLSEQNMDSSKYWNRNYLHKYAPALIESVRSMLDHRLMRQLGYSLDA